MNISELKTPIRIYWDLAPPGPGVPDPASIAGQIIDLKILSADLTAQTADAALLTVLERLATGRIAVSLTLPVAGITPELLADLAPLRLKQLSVGLGAFADMAAAVDGLLTSARQAGVSIGISFPVTGGNYREIPQVAAFCVERGVPLVLPMQRLTAGEVAFRLSGAERRELTEKLSGIEGRETVRVTIHDPFLWRAFYPEVQFPNGRCQAANTMLHIAADGEVHPCPTLPVSLGNLGRTTLAEIAVSAGKREVRERIMRTPAGCGLCADRADCLGGCRGRGLFVTGSWDEPDPGCGV